MKDRKKIAEVSEPQSAATQLGLCYVEEAMRWIPDKESVLAPDEPQDE